MMPSCEVNQLATCLKDGAEMLSAYEVRLKPERRWSEDLLQLLGELKAIESVEELKAFIVRHRRGLFGGMGSLLDLVIGPENGHVAHDFRKANEQLDAFRQRLYVAWQAIRKRIGCLCSVKTEFWGSEHDAPVELNTQFQALTAQGDGELLFRCQTCGTLWEKTHLPPDEHGRVRNPQMKRVTAENVRQKYGLEP